MGSNPIGGTTLTSDTMSNPLYLGNLAFKIGAKMQYKVRSDDKIEFRLDKLHVSKDEFSNGSVYIGIGATPKEARQHFIDQMISAHDSSCIFLVEGDAVSINPRIFTADHPAFLEG